MMKASSVSKRGSVFDSPFTTTAHHAEHTPLRHYENDSFAVFGELPQRRRRPRAVDTEHWIRLSMKAILLSPVVVLVVWSLFLATKTTSSIHSKSRSSVLPSRSRGDKGRFPVVAPLGAEGPVRTNNNNNNNIVQPVYYSRAQEQQLYAPQQQQQFQQQQQQQVMNTPQQPMAPMVVANAQGQPMLMAPQVVQNPQQQQQQVMMMAPAQQQFQQQQQKYPQQQMVEQQQQQQLPQQALGLPEQQTIPPQARTEQMSQHQQQQQETPLAAASQQAPVRYYYYDPAKTQQDPSGNLILPDTVYDSQGRAIPTAQLSGSITAAQQPQLESTGSTATSNATPVAEPHKELAIPTALAASTSLPADQSIIVGTVGVMALLVGALSARRLRSRGVLQVCLDDAVDDDAVAYDGAYTVASGPTYGTWKGDLEKFDV